MSFGKVFLIALLILSITFSVAFTIIGALFEKGPFAWINPDSLANILAVCFFMAVYLAARYSSESKAPAS